MAKASMFTVAKAAGTSTGTVSRVLNGGYVKAETRQRVVDVMRELNYSPRSAANRCDKVTVFVAWPFGKGSNSVSSGIITGLGQTLSGPNVQLVFTSFDGMSAKERVRHVRQLRTDVLIGIGPLPPEFLNMSGELKGLVQIGNWEQEERRCVHIAYDSDTAMKLAVGHLADHGHREIALLYTGEVSAGQRNYRRSFDHYLKRHAPGITPRHLTIGNADEVQQALTQLLQLPQRPTAAVLARSWHLLPLYQAASFAGISLPSDLSIVSDEEPGVSRYLTPPASTFEYDAQRLGRMAGEVAQQLLAEPNRRINNRKLKPILNERASVTVPRAG